MNNNKKYITVTNINIKMLYRNKIFLECKCNRYAQTYSLYYVWRYVLVKIKSAFDRQKNLLLKY